jgi:hypothetical protein
MTALTAVSIVATRQLPFIRTLPPAALTGCVVGTTYLTLGHGHSNGREILREVGRDLESMSCSSRIRGAALSSVWEVRQGRRQLHQLERVALRIDQHRDLDRRAADRHRDDVALDLRARGLRGGH